MGSVGMHSQVLRELAGGIVGPLFLIFGRMWSLMEERKYHFCLQEGQETESGEVQGGLPHFDRWGGDGQNKPGNHF